MTVVLVADDIPCSLLSAHYRHAWCDSMVVSVVFLVSVMLSRILSGRVVCFRAATTTSATSMVQL